MSNVISINHKPVEKKEELPGEKRRRLEAEQRRRDNNQVKRILKLSS